LGISTNEAKLQDMPLQIYIKEKHQPEVVVKDSKRRAKVSPTPELELTM
jgi:hypothetical protein